MVPLLPIISLTTRYVVVNKPSALLSVPGKGPDKADCVASRVAHMFPDATGPLIVHRLDMDTSGLILLALDPDAHRALSAQFEQRTVQKRYHALLEGHVLRPGDEGAIDLPMRLDVDNRPHQIVDHVQGKPAVTHYRVLAHEHLHAQPCTRIEFRPVTGRSHQLRLHAAHPDGLGAPILADDLYGHADTAPRLMLHATMLAFDDPSTGQRITHHAPAPF